MDAMELNAFSTAREQIFDRRRKLESAIVSLGPRTELTALLGEVDAALERIALGTYGLCEVCHTPVEPERLIADPLTRFCLDDLPPAEQRALEQDLQLAARVQQGLLPNPTCAAGLWDVAYTYRPARIVSGDYCDLVRVNGDLFFMVGDVSGKGVAAATVMSQLHALVRALLSASLPLSQLVEQASRLLCESTLPTHYATLVCGRAAADGVVELCNAGHVPPLVVARDSVRQLPAGGMPIGMFCKQQFDVQRLHLGPGEMIVLCTDGITEAEGGDPGNRDQFGLDRLAWAVRDHASSSGPALVEACVRAVDGWRGGRRADDDVTMMILRRPEVLQSAGLVA
jgi:sigma-B regulation protein RsbU (phosphoserine phosphatase)